MSTHDNNTANYAPLRVTIQVEGNGQGQAVERFLADIEARGEAGWTVEETIRYENGNALVSLVKFGDRGSITVERTGNAHSIASSEFRITYPNGHTETIWSPPWNDYGPETEEAGALKAAGERWFALCEAWQREVDEWETVRQRAAGGSE